MGKEKKITAKSVSVIVPHIPFTRVKEIKQLEQALAEQTMQGFELLIIEKRQSAFKSNNEGWQKAKGDIIWFLADDVVPEPKALEAALRVFERKDPDGVEGNIYGRLRRIFEWGFMSAHIFYKKSTLEKYGGFDECFAAWRGDTDLAWTVLEDGGKILYCPESRVFHRRAPTTVPDIEAEKLLKSKHRKRYEQAKKKNYLHCFL